jgi:3-methylfumaryl-CoA hydratase
LAHKIICYLALLFYVYGTNNYKLSFLNSLVLMGSDINNLRQWIGRVQESSDLVTAAPLACLNATLDRDDQEPQLGDELPPSGHWMYFLNPSKQSELDVNGHAKKGEFLPPVPLERRMWAGGRLKFILPLRIGDAITRTSEIIDVRLKEGKTGPLVFVIVRHQVYGPDGLSIEEEHDIVYRGRSSQNILPLGSEQNKSPIWQRIVNADSVLLFRYSALIFNGHRIHFDREYVTKDEGYPIFDLGPFTINGSPKDRGADLWALDQQKNLAMTAEAKFE